ncbi:MAG: hypothetical protein H7Y17_11595 [Chlorobia bacterium]|nr:hypothetical protein [Fimbriimonadaceae bacterium]
MIAVLAALTMGLSAQTLEVLPTDDIWVYPHASDPQKDGYLRVWGVDGQAVATDPGQADEFSYSYLKFDLAKLPKSAVLKSVVLTLMHTPDPAWQAEEAKASPLEVRPLGKDFSEKGWEFGLGKTVFPGGRKEDVFGSFGPAKIDAGQPIKFEVDLLKGPNKLLLSAGGSFGVALTSKLDPSAIGNRAVYKFYSKDYDKAEYRPKLTISYE